MPVTPALARSPNPAHDIAPNLGGDDTPRCRIPGGGQGGTRAGRFANRRLSPITPTTWRAIGRSVMGIPVERRCVPR
jgi:hypothetical protein